MDEINYNRLSTRAGMIFTPSTPVSNRHLFSGREYQLNRIIDTIFANGQHAIIYGERGVGKTSLANILENVLEPREQAGRIVFARVNCDGTDNFSSVWLKAMERIKFLVTKPQLGFGTEQQTEIVTLADSLKGKSEIRIEDIRNVGDIKGLRFVFIFDEFDRIGGENSSTLFADTIKMLSDYSIDVTLILIGVADNVAKLVKEHASIDRSLVQVLMPRMTSAEVKGIIDSSIKELGMTISEAAKSNIVELSQGLPHYTHLVGLTSARRCLRKKKMDIDEIDVFEGVQDAIIDAQQTVIEAYNKAITSPRKETLFKQVLLACALSPVDELGYFAPSDVREPLEKILGHEIVFASFMRHLMSFCSVKRGETLSKIGEKRAFRFRFKNPLLQPYIVMKGIGEGLYKFDQPEEE